MPREDITGPGGQGAETDRGIGKQKDGGLGLDLGAHCVCPNCGQRSPHKFGIPCSEQHCPNCGSAMIRE